MQIIEACNRCCSKDYTLLNGYVHCNYCSHSEILNDWQLIGWRDILKNPPHFKGTIHVYGKQIGRTMANWDSITKTCDNSQVTHWLRVPDPTKQIGM